MFDEEGDLVPTSQTWANAQAFAIMNNVFLAQYGVNGVVTGIASHLLFLLIASYTRESRPPFLVCSCAKLLTPRLEHTEECQMYLYIVCLATP